MIKGQIIHNPRTNERIKIASEARRMTPEEIHHDKIRTLEFEIGELFLEYAPDYIGEWPPNRDPRTLTKAGRSELRKHRQQLRLLVNNGVKPVAIKDRPFIFNVIREYAGLETE